MKTKLLYSNEDEQVLTKNDSIEYLVKTAEEINANAKKARKIKARD